MGTWLRKEFSSAADLFSEANDILGYDLAALCDDGPAEKLNQTIHSQPALFVVGMAAATVYSAEQPKAIESVTAVAGLSLGEYTAVCFAGGLSFADALRVVDARGQAMQACADAVPSGMASVLGLDLDALTAVCQEAREDGEVLQPANLLCPGNIAVSGHSCALERLEPVASAAGAMKVVPLSVAGAFHTPLMQDAVSRLTSVLESADIQDTRLPVFSNVDAAPHTCAKEIRDLLARQVVAPVQWEASIRAMLDSGVGRFVECGTGRVLRGTLKRIARKVPTDGFGDETA